MCQTILNVSFSLAVAASAALAGEQAGPLAERLIEVPANVPVKVEESASGGRQSAAFFWSPNLGRFVLAAGILGKQRHYDVEHFDPATGRWTNAYPQGAPYKAGSGPTDAPVHGIPRGGAVSLVDAKGVSRLPLAPEYYGVAAVYMHFQYALDPVANRFYGLYLNRMVTCDLQSGVWKFAGSDSTSAMRNLNCTTAWGVTGFTGEGCFVEDQVLQWGSFCWDPINKEVLSVGGSSMDKGFTPGSWVYKTGAGQWEKLKLGAPELATLQDEAEKLRQSSWALLSHARSRFFITESPDEAKTKLSEAAGKLKADLTAFGRKVVDAKLPGTMNVGRKQAVERINKTAEALGGIASSLDGQIDAGLLLKFRDAHRLLETAVCDLDHEPRGRAHSRMVWDPVNEKIVLFGGDGLDRCYGDTWVYDPTSRSWEQRYPAVAPAPRAAHVLDWLPESKQVVLTGGYSKGPLPFEVWIYDVAKNQWSNLQSVELKGRSSPDCPTAFRNLDVVGAAGTGDVVVMVEGNRRTWAMRVDPAAPAATAGDRNGLAPSSVDYKVEMRTPEFYEAKARIEPEKMDQFFKGLPVNKWVKLPDAPVRPRTRDYGTCRYDPVRKQFLWWGGGHVNYWGTEVNHFSLRSGCWTASEPPDEPLEPCGGMCVRVGASFQGRPQIHTHAYQYYDYDPVMDRLVCSKVGWTYFYNPSSRLWESPPSRGGMAAVRTSPGGVFGAGGRNGISRLDSRERKWLDLPATGDKIPGIKENYQGFCYDSKRDSVWYFNRAGAWQYDVKSGHCQRKSDKVTERHVKGYFSEIVYLPELDKFLVDGRNFWDPAAGQWLGADIPAVEADGSPAKKGPDFGATYGLCYDPETKLVLHNDGGSCWALRLDPTTLKMEECK